MKTRRNSPLALLLLAAVTTGCPRPKSQRPDAAYQTFATALSRGDWKTAWHSLSKPTQAAIEDRQKKASDLTDGAVPKDAMLTFFASGYKPRPIESIQVLSEEGDTAVVEIRIGDPSDKVVSEKGEPVVKEIQMGDAGSVYTQPMVKEGARWVVDLTEQFK